MKHLFKKILTAIESVRSFFAFCFKKIKIFCQTELCCIIPLIVAMILTAIGSVNNLFALRIVTGVLSAIALCLNLFRLYGRIQYTKKSGSYLLLIGLLFLLATACNPILSGKLYWIRILTNVFSILFLFFSVLAALWHLYGKASRYRALSISYIFLLLGAIIVKGLFLKIRAVSALPDLVTLALLLLLNFTEFFLPTEEELNAPAAISIYSMPYTEFSDDETESQPADDTESRPAAEQPTPSDGEDSLS